MSDEMRDERCVSREAAEDNVKTCCERGLIGGSLVLRFTSLILTLILSQSILFLIYLQS